MTPSVWSRNPPLIERHPDNPILTAADWPYRANTVFNPGATMLLDGTTLLLCRVEDMRGHSHLTVARSKDGVSNWEIDRTANGRGSETIAHCWTINSQLLHENPLFVISRLRGGRRRGTECASRAGR